MRARVALQIVPKPSPVCSRAWVRVEERFPRGDTAWNVGTDLPASWFAPADFSPHCCGELVLISAVGAGGMHLIDIEHRGASF
jgi:hypothetical protein